MIWIIVIATTSILGVAGIFTFALAKSAGKASREEFRREQLQSKLKHAAKIAEKMSQPLPDDDAMDEWVRNDQ